MLFKNLWDLSWARICLIFGSDFPQNVLSCKSWRFFRKTSTQDRMGISVFVDEHYSHHQRACISSNLVPPPRRHESLLPSSPRSVSVSCGSLVFSSRQSCNPLPISDVTILLSLTVFLNTVSESMPATSDAVPLISKEGEEQEINKLRLGWHSARFCKWSFTQAHVNSAWLSQMSNNLRHTHVVSTCLRIKLFDQLRELNPAPGYEVYPDGPFSIWHLHHWVF